MPQNPVEKIIESRPRQIAGQTVGRLLPAMGRKSVGPFVFLDHLGPTAFAPGIGFDVPPHPHIGLSTVTYLFAGEAVHRDSLEYVQTIRPGDINWMTAGRGIVHSERSSDLARSQGGALHGMQCWVALPRDVEEMAPEFHHHAASSLPEVRLGQAELRILAGRAYGHTSPVRTFSPLFYVEARLPAGSALPMLAEYPERAIYIIAGTLAVAETNYDAHRLLILSSGEVEARAVTDCHLVLIGGEPLECPHYIDWNFVASSKERIDRAKTDWKERRFPSIPTDDREFVPLPE